MALSAKTIKTILAIKDNVSPGLKNINKNFKALNKATNNLSRNLGNVAKMTVLPLVGSFAAVGASIKSCVTDLHEYGTSLFNTSKALGIASDDLAKFRYIAQLSGSSAEQMDAGLRVLNKNIANSAAGKNKDFLKMLEKLNISFKNADGSIKTAAQLMPELAEAMKSQTTQAQKAYIAQTAFGKSGADLIQTLERGKEGFAELSKDAEKYGLVIGDDAVNASLALDDALNHQNAALKGLKLTIGSQLIPTIAPLLEQMNDWIAQNREWIASEINRAVKDFVTSVKSIDFKKVITQTVQFVKNCAQLFKQLGGLKTIAIAVGAIFGGKLVLAIAGVVKSIWTVITAVKALTIALMTNPIIAIITAIVAAVAGLAYAGYLIYKHWDTVKAWFVEMWEQWGGVIKVFSLIFSPIIGVIIIAAEQIIKNWEPIKEFFISLWQSICNAFEVYTQILSDAWDGICALPGKVADSWDGLKNYFRDLWESIKGFFFAPFEKASRAVIKSKDYLKSIFSFGDDSDKSSSIDMGGLSASMPGALAQSSEAVDINLMVKTDSGVEVEQERVRQTAGTNFTFDTGVTR